MYADDLKIYKQITCKKDCKSLQEDITAAQNWLSSVGLFFHPNKCYKMTYRITRSYIDYEYKINNIPIQQVETISDLGVIFNSNLTWDTHIDSIINQANKRLGMVIRCCKPIQDIDTITILYKSIIRSKIDYCSALWTPNTKTKIKKLEKIQASFVRYLFQKVNGFYPKYPQNISYELLIENLIIDSVETRLTENQIKFLKNILTNKINSTYLTTKLEFRVPNHRLRADPTKLFNVNTNPTLLKSPIIAAMETYNKLDNKPDLFTTPN
ncbi:hypothetical protein WDU94_005470 [Cyamophila willieti]